MTDTRYPQFISWRMELGSATQPEHILSRDRSRRIKKAQNMLTGSPYRFIAAAVDGAYLDRFVPLYQDYIGGTLHGEVYDVRGKLEQGWREGKHYEAISLWRRDAFVGGLMYSVQPTFLSVAYRVFPHQLTLKLPITCSFIAEYYLIERALHLRTARIIHGRDHNVFGQHTKIGLASYKLNIGCLPYASRATGNQFGDYTELKPASDLLVFLANEPQQAITAGVLYTNTLGEERRKKYGVLLNHPSVRMAVLPYAA